MHYGMGIRKKSLGTQETRDGEKISVKEKKKTGGVAAVFGLGGASNFHSLRRRVLFCSTENLFFQPGAIIIIIIIIVINIIVFYWGTHAYESNHKAATRGFGISFLLFCLLWDRQDGPGKERTFGYGIVVAATHWINWGVFIAAIWFCVSSFFWQQRKCGWALGKKWEMGQIKLTGWMEGGFFLFSFFLPLPYWDVDMTGLISSFFFLFDFPNRFPPFPHVYYYGCLFFWIKAIERDITSL